MKLFCVMDCKLHYRSHVNALVTAGKFFNFKNVKYEVYFKDTMFNHWKQTPRDRFSRHVMDKPV